MKKLFRYLFNTQRYFVIGYSYDVEGRTWQGELCVGCSVFPARAALKTCITEESKEEEISSIIITGLFEFKSKADSYSYNAAKPEAVRPKTIITNP